MNWLAHLYFAEPTVESAVGNMLADFLHGYHLADWPEPVQDGVRQHRRVDAFMDSHPAVRASTSRIRPLWGRYSGVLIDMYYDYLLATSWSTYSEEALHDFATRMYRLLAHGRDLMPIEMVRVVDGLIAYNALEQYATHEGIGRGIQGLARRFRHHEVHLDGAIDDLRAREAALRGDFDIYFPQLIEHMRLGTLEESGV